MPYNDSKIRTITNDAYSIIHATTGGTTTRWPGSLVAHFRPQITVAGAFTTVGLLLARKPLLAASTAVITAANARQVFSYKPPPEKNCAHDPHKILHVASFNVLESNTNYDDLLTWVLTTKADVIILIETNPSWLEAIIRATRNELHEPYHLAGAITERSGRGMAILTKNVEAKVLYPNFSTERGSLAVEIEHHGQQIIVAGLHPPSPRIRSFAKERDLQIRKAFQWAQEQPHAVVLAGDFNITLYAKTMQDIVASFNLTTLTKKVNWRPTWRHTRGLGLIQAPIDHVFVTQGLQIQRLTAGPYLGSDHRCMLTEIACCIDYSKK